MAQTSTCTADGCCETEAALLARAPRGVSPGSGRQKLPACWPRTPGAASGEPGSPETLPVRLRKTGSLTLSPLQGSSRHSSALPHLPCPTRCCPTPFFLALVQLGNWLGLLCPRNVHVLSPLPRRGSPLPLPPHPGISLSMLVRSPSHAPPTATLPAHTCDGDTPDGDTRHLHGAWSAEQLLTERLSPSRPL